MDMPSRTQPAGAEKLRPLGKLSAYEQELLKAVLGELGGSIKSVLFSLSFFLCFLFRVREELMHWALAADTEGVAFIQTPKL